MKNMQDASLKPMNNKMPRKIVSLLLKAYRQYYFSSLLHLNFYKLIGNKPKVEKWQSKHQTYHEHLASMKIIYLQSKAWIKSSEFKEKYLDTNHPYPPLLNPNNIDYELIPADLAWELNLPLPPKYLFYNFSNGSAASWATFEFFKVCGINCGTKNDIFDPKDIFIYYYNAFIKFNKSKEIYIFFSYFCSIMLFENAGHLVTSLSKKAPLFYVARCPIGRLKHLINHQDSDFVWAQRISQINLTFDYTKLFPKLKYWGEVSVPSFKILNDNSIVFEKLMFDSALDKFQDKISFIHCIEFNALKADKAFDTFCKLADALGFEKPTNKEIFTNRVNRNCGTLTTLPTTLYAHPDDLPNTFKEGQEEKRSLDSLNKKGGFSVIVTLPHYVTDKQKDFADISDEIYPNLIIDDTRILIIIDKDELLKLKENTELFNATKTYLKGYLNALIDNTNKIKANLITESQILEYLRSNDEVRKNIKRILDSELNYIKTHHPDFIQKWKYYLEFEKMCAELDDENLNGRQK